MRGAFCSSVPSFLNSSVYTVTHAASIRESRGGLGVCACAPGDTTPAMERTNGANSATGLMEHPSYSLQQSLRRPRRVADYGDRRPLKADLAQKALHRVLPARDLLLSRLTRAEQPTRLHEQHVEKRASRQHERSKEHTSELQSRLHLVCRLLLEKKKKSRCRSESPI